jgi:hypothetical protein
MRYISMALLLFQSIACAQEASPAHPKITETVDRDARIVFSELRYN